MCSGTAALQQQKRSLEDFLTHNKHHIYHVYHLYNINSRCCQCPASYVFPTQRQLITNSQWTQLFNTSCLPCQQHRKRPAGGPQTICAYSVTPGIIVANLGVELSQTLIYHFCILKKSLEKLVQMRNNVFGHAKEARISDNNYAKYRYQIEYDLLLIAEICNNKGKVQQKLKDLDRRTLDGTLLLKTIRDQFNTVGEISALVSEEVSNIKTDMKAMITQQTTDITKKIEQERSDIMTRIEQKTTKISTNIEHTKSKIMTQTDQKNTEMAAMIEKMIMEIRTKKETESSDMREYFDRTLKDAGNERIKLEIKENHKKLIENTENLIKAHTNENTFVHTNAVDKAVACLQKHKMVILIGSPGIGKSRIGLELLRQISMNERCRCIKLDDILQWQNMSDGMDAVFIDDVFGRTNCSYNDDAHSRMLERIFAAIENKKVQVILSLRKSIYQAIGIRTECHRIFQGQYVLDLSSDENKMTVEEKKSCLTNYLTKNRIVETNDPCEENINDDSILDTNTTVYLYNAILHKIINADIGELIGYPEICYLFASHRKFTKQGHIFFCHPTEHLAKEIDNLREEGQTNERRMIDFTLLVYILLHGDGIDLCEINLDEVRSIMKTLYSNPVVNIPKSYINDSAKRLSGRYLKISNDGKLCFQHQIISEAVTIAYSSTDPSSVIPLLGFDFITEMARPQNYRPDEGEVVFPVPVACYSLLAHKLLQLMNTDFKSLPFQFVQNLCKAKIITMTGNDILREIIKEYKYRKSDIVFEDLHYTKLYPWYSYFLKASYFFLPPAIMMFGDINNDSLYQCLYDSIHSTLTSKDSQKKEMCEKTLVRAFHFAISSLDINRSSVILKILKEHDIQQIEPPQYFCPTILTNTSFDAIRLMLTLHDQDYEQHVFNIFSFLSSIFRFFSHNNMDSEEEFKRILTYIRLKKKLDKSFANEIMKCLYSNR